MQYLVVCTCGREIDKDYPCTGLSSPIGQFYLAFATFF